MHIENLLEVEIESEFEKLSEMEVTDESHKAAVDSVSKLLDRAIEYEKLNIDRRNQAETREFEQNLKLKQMEEDRKDRIVRNSIAAGGVVLPLAVTIWGALKSWQFEKEGVVTSSMGRMFMNCFRLKK